MSNLYIQVKSDKGDSRVIQGGDYYVELVLQRDQHRHCTIGWCKETNEVCVYGYNDQKILCLSPEQLGHLDKVTKM